MIHPLKRTPRKNLDMEEMKRLYAEGASLNEIAQRFGVTHRTVTKRLEMYDVQIRGIKEVWNEKERMAKASAKSRAIRTAKIAEETGVVFDPMNAFSEVEKIVISRLFNGGASFAVGICQNRWPAIPEMEAWFALLRLHREGYLFQPEKNLWKLTGCGLLVAGRWS
jgi:hypothetical protein